MKMLKKLSLAASITAALTVSSTAIADSWKIIQGVTPGANTIMSQTATTTNASIQTLNNINLDSSAGNVNTGSTQTVTLGGNSLTLTQDASTTGSTQAANWAAADKITDLAQDIAATAGTIQLNQNATVGNSNIQAINGVKADTIVALTQDITVTGTDLDMNQEGAQKNTQTGNLISAIEAVPSGVTQTVSVKQADLEQKTTTSAFQAGNALLTATGGAGGEISQAFTTADTLGIIQNATDGSYQSANYAGVVITN